ncbi:hypothetical protein N7457_008204 [Penicillium paradoxum]|uniref:uncharacterized protein n=1 Tax=Penicillium paradoxum TaxID=176176 RepID=UPI002546BF18|nr:uncharacterized protein N7457_008204 [Penicillium paradoxum]KAJ5773308.1 hypothetical protein N7457_008204 [Penicillium paradoxum]
MGPQITSWDDLTEVWEQRDDIAGQIRHTSFAVFDNSEQFYYGRIEAPKTDVTFDQMANALRIVPDEEVYTKWPASSIALVQNPRTPIEGSYIKRPCAQMYEVLKDHNALAQLSNPLVAEAELLYSLSQNPHPNIIGYHGCQVLRGYFIGIVLDRHPYDLYTFFERQFGTIDIEPFMTALESAVYHLHTHGLAHNDLNSRNILVNKEGMPILIDFGGCQPTGTYLKFIRGTKEWIDGEIKDYNTSDKEHDISALAKIRAWLDKPVFDE